MTTLYTRVTGCSPTHACQMPGVTSKITSGRIGATRVNRLFVLWINLRVSFAYSVVPAANRCTAVAEDPDERLFGYFTSGNVVSYAACVFYDGSTTISDVFGTGFGRWKIASGANHFLRKKKKNKNRPFVRPKISARRLFNVETRKINYSPVECDIMVLLCAL